MELKLKFKKFVTCSILVIKKVDGRMFDVAWNCPAPSSFLGEILRGRRKSRRRREVRWCEEWSGAQ